MRNLDLRIWSIMALIFSSFAWGQDGYLEETRTPVRIEESTWQEKVGDRDYYEKADPKVEKKEADLNPGFDWSSLSWLVYVLIGLLVALVVFLLVKVISTKQNLKVSSRPINYEDIDRLEEDLAEADLDSFLRKALEQGDHRLAVRILYLMILKSLQETGAVAYRKDKTNFNYVMEMHEHQHGAEFRRLTQAFELIWYGEAAFGADSFSQVKRPFERYLNRLKTDERAG